MLRLTGCFLTLLLASPLLLAETRWIQMRSDSFQVFSSAGERATRDTLRHFEQVRNFFVQSLGDGGQTLTQPVRIVIFGSRKDYEPYRFNEFAVAYYRPGADTDYIVMSQAGVEAFPIAIHEYFHLVAKHTGVDLPVWLNEGMAELYSTLEPRGDKILVGTLIPGRHIPLLRDKWVPLSLIIAADHDSPYYNEKDKAGSFYNESWAFVHMLMLHDAYRPKFKAFLTAVGGGMPSAQALEKTYGRPLPLIERDLLNYLRGDRFQAALLGLKLTKISQDLRAEPAPAFDLALTLAELTNLPGREEQSRRAMEQLTRDDPKRPEPHAALGYLAWHTKDTHKAVPHFQQAYQLGSRSSRFLWDYGRLAADDDRDGSAKALAELLQRMPDRMEVRLLLASVQLAAERYQEALVALQPVKKVNSSDAPQFFRTLAFANMRVGNKEEALRAARQWEKYAPENEKSEAEHLMQYLERPTQVMRAETPMVDDLADGGRPRMIRGPARGAPVTEPPAPPEFEEAMGEFQHLDCTGAKARIVILTIRGRQTFLIDDPKSVFLSGAGAATIDMSCGPQRKKVAVRIRYTKPPAGGSGLEGIVKAIEFQK